MFENERKLHQFMKNISDYTKVGGYFIGTCFDGKKIFNLLKKKKKIEIFSENIKLCHIEKKYSDEQDIFLENTHESLNYKISVYQESINKEIDEYLVNFDYLKKILNDYGFTLDDSIEHPNIPGKQINCLDSFETLFKIMNDDENEEDKKNFGESLLMSDQEKEISFLNNYFIFRKVRDISKYLYNFETNEIDKLDLKIERAKKLPKKIILEK